MADARFAPLALLALVAACAAARAAPTLCPDTDPPPPRSSLAAPDGGPASARAYLTLRVRPEPASPARVHVELHAAGRAVTTLRLATGAASDLTALTARDDADELGTKVTQAGGGVDVVLARPSRGELRVAYDVAATTDAGAVTGALVVADDRFRAMGERLVLLPGGFEDARADIVSTTRPLGAYTIVPRFGGLLVHLGPSEPWSPAMRVNLTQHLMHAWLGGELRLAQGVDGGEADAAWLHDGVARYLGARLLEQTGLMKPADAMDYVTGLLSVQATSSQRGKSHADVAQLARGNAAARALLVARGALFAERLGAKLRARSKGARSLESAVFLPLLQAAREARSASLSLEALDDAIARELGPGASKERESLFSGADVALPDGALGPCFRLGAGQYVAFDLGFDMAATLDGPKRAIVDLAPGGPAAGAGLADGDTLEDASYKDGHADAPVKLTVLRAGKKLELGYMPRGPRKPGQIVERARDVADAACGEVL